MARGSAQPGHQSIPPAARLGGDDVQIEATGASHFAGLEMNGLVDYQTKVYQTGSNVDTGWCTRAGVSGWNIGGRGAPAISG